MLWQGRRFGPLVVEPLPVVVRAARPSRAGAGSTARPATAQHAADALRADARARWRAHLAASPSATDDELIDRSRGT